MPLTRVKIENFKSIRYCDISLSELNVLIGENGTGKTNILEALDYFYQNLTESHISNSVFDENNRFSNEVNITVYFDFSKFVKISKSNSDDSILFDDQPSTKVKYTNYYRTIISMATTAPNRILVVSLKQVKGQPVKWNCPFKDRLIFRSLFPFFYIDTRTLDVNEWGYIWDVLGELGKVSHNERKMIEAEINKILLDDSKETSKKLKGITNIFAAADVSVKTAMSKDFAKNLAKIYFSGDTIHQSGKQLGYYSTGTNSIKYIELLVKAIDEIAKTKLKEPIILMDEPEISLHPLFMDELSAAITDVNPKLRVLISTHSARLTKNLITETNGTTLYNVKLINHYSYVQHMERFPQYSPESKYRVTDDHINSYFSRAILFVEGETELELFSNPYLRMLFPKLRSIDIFKAMSQAPILNIMNPRLTHTNIPYLCLIDMDKAVRYDRSSKKFSLQNEYFKQSNRECLRYRNKHESSPYLYNLHKRIEKMASKLHVHYYMPYVSCEDQNYFAFIEAIHDYLMFYNVFTLTTTIEGCLINEKTMYFALDYLQEHKSEKDFNDFIAYISGLLKTDQVNALRIAFNGKSDLLQGYKYLSKSTLSKSDCELLERIMVGKKTSGWVSEFLDGYFKKASNLSSSFSIKTFKRYLDEGENLKTIKKRFEQNFFELHSLISKVCDMI